MQHLKTLQIDQVTAVVEQMTILKEFPQLQEAMIACVRRELPRFEVPIEIFLTQAVGSWASQGVAETVAAWLMLFHIAGMFDNVVDRDKDMGEWFEGGHEAALFLALAVTADAWKLPLASGAERAVHAADRLAAMVRDSSLGQRQDVMYVRTIPEYEAMARRKSGRIFGGLLEAVVALVSSDKHVEHAARCFGEEVGLAIQVLNDWEGIWRLGDLYLTSDLQKEQHTLPILYGLVADYDPALRDEFHLLWSVDAGKRDAERLLSILNQTPFQTFMNIVLMGCRKNASLAVAEFQGSHQESLIQWFDRSYLRQVKAS